MSRNAFITGAGAGIGREIAARLGRAGWRVTVLLSRLLLWLLTSPQTLSETPVDGQIADRSPATAESAVGDTAIVRSIRLEPARQ